VFGVADDVVILNSGRVAVDAPAAELKRDRIELLQYLGIS
jgi:ABC-type branched-subunit amino acid transport system ATPase component